MGDESGAAERPAGWPAVGAGFGDAPQPLQLYRLRLRLDALGDEVDAEVPGQRDDGVPDRRPARPHVRRGDRPVELDDVDREVLQVAEPAVALAEVVEREPDAEPP